MLLNDSHEQCYKEGEAVVGETSSVLSGACVGRGFLNVIGAQL